ncbi:importin subunit beta-1 isoform X2 [Amborella trichopoda]|nr:importin subunit beta-1 isoform X2 [Amborella trichopoda]|eukprot:XP_020523223.1 importin subunit beta-1 isoform X2 [Amborella trichopoda]
MRTIHSQMALEVTQILLNAQSVDGTLRKQAEETLNQFLQTNLQSFLISLSAELANNDKPIESRKLAGLMLKNALDAKDHIRKAELARRWLSIDKSVKDQIKVCLLQTLSSPIADARSTSSQVVAKVATIELPQNQWPELISTLLLNMGSPQVQAPTHLKQATLETLGYLCEEVSSDVIAQDQINSILTAVVQGMNIEKNNEVKLAATRALYNALGFAHSNFENNMERDYIIRVVCEATQSTEIKTRQAAFECLVSISSLYYDKLSPYMQNALLPITVKAVREDEEQVALQAIEFWSSICDEEIEIQEDYGGDFSGDSDLPCFYFIKQALPTLVPMLLETLLKQEEDQDQDEGAWNLAMAGGTCLGLVARTVGDDIVPLVMPFVEQNIAKPDWRQREAATYAFGSILEGPSPDKLAPLVNVALNFILNAMKDVNNHVKDTTAWTLGRIFEFLHGPNIGTAIITEVNIHHILSVLIEGMKDVPNVAEKSCGALYFLAQGYEDGGSASSPLLPYFENIVQALLVVAHRDDANDSRLRTSAYETLNEVVRCSTEEAAPLVMQLVPVLMFELSSTLDTPKLSSEEREKQNELQGLLCGCLQVIVQKLGASESTKYGFMQHANHLMNLFFRVFACRNATVHEEAMLAIGALAYAIGQEFLKYMPDFYRYLEIGLQNFEEYQVCAITVGVVGDICRALDDKILLYCDGIMMQLLKALSSNQLHRSVKPPIFSCFGDIALAIGESFEKYLIYAMPMLQSAAELTAQATSVDDEMIEYTSQLRNGILEAYSGIFQGFKNSSKTGLMTPYSPYILQFLESIYQIKDMEDLVTKAAVGVLGDLVDTLDSSAVPLLRQSVFYKDFVDECLSSDDPQIKETAEWVQHTINRVVSG